MKTQFGQLLLTEMPKAAWSASFERLLARFQPAGVLFRSFSSPASARELVTASAGALASAPFVAIEDEGLGPLSALFAPQAHPNPLDLASAERMSDLIGHACALMGLNLNLAPTVDLPAGAGSDGVTKRAEAFVRGFTRHRVLCCGRHFPGLEIKSAETTRDAPVVAKTMNALWREDLVPYRALGGKLSLIEISHAVYKAYDYEFPRPASFSPSVVEGLLRMKLGYQGIALADASAAARAARIEVGEAAVRAIAAGCDLVLIPGGDQAVEAVSGSLERACEVGRIPRERVVQAIERVRSAKKRLPSPPKEPSERDWWRLVRDFEEIN